MRKKAFVGPKRQSKVWSEEVNSIEVCEISSDDGVFCFDTEPVSVSSSDGSTHRHTESLSLSLCSAAFHSQLVGDRVQERFFCVVKSSRSRTLTQRLYGRVGDASVSC